MQWGAYPMHKSLATRCIGFIVSLIFTMVAFIIVMVPDFLHLKMTTNVLFLLLLAVLQFVTQSICFLNILDEKGPRWNLVVFLSTLTMVLIIIIGSIWIMDHLDCHMMGMSHS
jgi:cytochrome o ubiquinol oxidase operon protein cyoD